MFVPCRKLCSEIISFVMLVVAMTIKGAAADGLNSVESSRWSYARLQQRAKDLASRSFVGSPGLPEELQRLDYDSYRLIAFRHEKAIWKNDLLPFWLEFFHRGYLFRDKVTLNVVEKGQVNPLPFDRQLFQYRGKVSDLSVPADVGFAGFRVVGQFASSPHPLEVASFLGASYFRAIGEGQVYGTSARGLAVDIGLAKAEEFPVFREFWIERPNRESRQLRMWALLDSPSVAGAYELALRPGGATLCDVTARLFFRRQPEKIGLAPLSSMWMWGDGRPGPHDDPRPEVHDADGLLVWTSAGEWVWRPFSQQGYPSLSHYDFTGVRGLGLLQRDRRPEVYRDDEAKYHLRPSVWIEPLHGWPAGAVELLELPAKNEGVDNIAAWWTPTEPVQIGKPLDLHYTVSFMSGEPQQHVGARAIDTRVERRPGQPIAVEIDFAGQLLASFPDDAPIVPEIECLRGTASRTQCIRQRDGVWRVRFEVHPAGSAPIEMRAVLKRRGRTVSESWRYLCPI